MLSVVARRKPGAVSIPVRKLFAYQDPATRQSETGGTSEAMYFLPAKAVTAEAALEAASCFLFH